MVCHRDQSQVHPSSLRIQNQSLISNTLWRFNVVYHIYVVYHTQLYVSYDPRVPGDVDAAQRRLTNCIAEVKDWMLANKLRLNDTKTEFFLISSPRQINSVLRVNLRIGGSVIAPSSSIRI